MLKSCLIFLFFNIIVSCELLTQESIKFLALGDSYTKGESVERESSWPYLLKKELEKELKVDLQVIAETGWRTDDLAKAIATVQPSSNNDLVSLSIGVNNQYQHQRFGMFKNDFKDLLIQSIQLASNDTSNVLVVSIPDYSYSPFGQKMDHKSIENELAVYNEHIEETCKSLGVLHVDITPSSKNKKSEWYATDGLHPSPLQYAAWVELIKYQLSRHWKAPAR